MANSIDVDRIFQEASAYLDAGNYNKAYDLANYGVENTDDPSFYFIKFLALQKL